MYLRNSAPATVLDPSSVLDFLLFGGGLRIESPSSFFCSLSNSFALVVRGHLPYVAVYCRMSAGSCCEIISLLGKVSLISKDWDGNRDVERLRV